MNNKTNNSSDVISSMIIPLWARAVEQKHKDPILYDENAKKIIDLLEYSTNHLDEKRQQMTQVGCCLRGKWIDDQTEKFLLCNEIAQIIQLGAGLDARLHRIKNTDKIKYWYDLDLPDAMKIRKKVLPPKNENNIYLEMSLFDENWMRLLSENKLPTLIIIEGVMMYFTEAEIKKLLTSIKKYFPSATFLMDATPFALVGKAKHHDSLKKHNKNLEFTWGLKDKKDLKKLNENICIEEWVYMSDLPKANRFKTFFKVLLKIPYFHKNYNQLLLRFKI